MGKVGSPRRTRNESKNDGSLFGAKEYHRYVETRREQQWSKNMEATKCKGKSRHHWVPKHARSIVFMLGLMGFLFLLDSLMVSVFHSMHFQHSSTPTKSSVDEEVSDDHLSKRKAPVQMYSCLLSLASTSLAEKEFKRESSNYWEEPYQQASTWKPCAAEKSSNSLDKPNRSNGYIVVSANGGLNQQRVAICNAVAVASLLNATLVLPKFLYSNVWKDPSQFGDIYQEDYFMKVLKDDINIVKDLPARLKALDIEAIGSLITDSDIVKEAKPDDYFRVALPLLLQNGVVHFLGYGNRLGFDSLPFNLQRLRCKCNFHALKFVPKIQETGSLLVRRIRKYDGAQSMLDRQLLGNFMPVASIERDAARRPSKSVASRERDAARRPSKYLALHMRFEMDMVAYSFCEFGGGEMEHKELEAYRELHFPLVLERLRKSKPPSPAKLRKLGKCPLTPEEAGLVLAALGFKRGTYIYLAGSQIYGGESRMKPFTRLYPNLVTKETLLSPSELQPFRNFSSQMAALDFIACATADVFSMTDSGSQLSSLVSGFRTYYGGDNAPNLRPNKKRLAAVLSKNRSIDWNSFEDRVRKMIEEGQRLRVRGYGRSIYRQPSCPECMCKNESPF